MALPARAAHAAGAALGLAGYHLIRYRRGMIEASMARSLSLALDDPALHRLVRANYVHYGRLVVEILRLRRITVHGRVHDIEIHGREHLDHALEDGRGALVLTAHAGNYELPAVVLASLGYPINIVSKTMKLKDVERFWMAEREAAGLRIFTKESPPRQLLRALHDNQVLGIVLDQHAHVGGIRVRFFDRPAYTLRLLAVLAERSRAPVVPVFARRLDDGTHRLTILPSVPFQRCSTREETCRVNTQRYTSIIEDAVRQAPEQWTWIHRRWKTTHAPRRSERTIRHEADSTSEGSENAPREPFTPAG